LKISYIQQIADKDVVLMVEDKTLQLIKDFSCMSQIYPVAKIVFPDMRSLYITNNSFTENIKSGKIELQSVEVLK
jgi:hypothetical protein